MRRLVLRSLALIAIGLVVFGWWGEGGGLDSLRIPGVLQRIGLSGLIAGVIVVGLRKWWAVAIAAAALLAVYGWVLTVPTVDGCRGVDVPACTVPGQLDDADVRVGPPLSRRCRGLRPGGPSLDLRRGGLGAPRMAGR